MHWVALLFAPPKWVLGEVWNSSSQDPQKAETRFTYTVAWVYAPDAWFFSEGGRSLAELYTSSKSKHDFGKSVLLDDQSHGS